MQGKTVVILRTSSVARIPVYQHLKAEGLRMIVVHPFNNDNFKGIFDHWLLHDTHDVDALESYLNRKFEELHIIPDAIISFDEYAVYPAALLAERMCKRPIPLPSDAMHVTNVKSKFRKWCYANGLNAPKSHAIYNRDVDLAEELSELEYPIVLKPSPGAGSLLAKMCRDEDEAFEHMNKMFDVLDVHPDVKHFKALNAPVHVLAEEYIGGQEVDIDCAIDNGEIKFASISDNFEVLPPFFVERGGTCPSALPDHKQEALHDLLRTFVKGQGSAIHGVLHFEAKYDHDRQKAYVIEVNCRLGSAETNTMVTQVYGVQLGECLVRCALGIPLDNIKPDSHIPRKHCASVNIYPEKIGTLTRAAAPVEDNSLINYSISATPGSKVSPPPKTFYLLAWMVCGGSTHDEAVVNIKRATSNFVQEIDEEIEEPVVKNNSFNRLPKSVSNGSFSASFSKPPVSVSNGSFNAQLLSAVASAISNYSAPSASGARHPASSRPRTGSRGPGCCCHEHMEGQTVLQLESHPFVSPVANPVCASCGVLQPAH